MTALDGVDAPVVLPAHPRPTDAFREIRWKSEGSLHLFDPLGYFDFLPLLSSVRVVVINFGVVQ